jgi:hypothetical protein
MTDQEHPLAGQAAGPNEQELAEALADATDREHELSRDCWCGPTVETVTLDERDVAADLGGIDPAAVPSVDRPDGAPGFTEQYAGATLAPLQSTAAEFRLREGDQQLPTGDPDAPNIHELVVTDLLNRMALGKKRYGQSLKPWNGRDPLRDAYEELLDGAAYLRQAMFERDGT